MSQLSSSRIGWVDYAKGFCIILVVMMHSTHGVEIYSGEEGWTHAFAAFAKPFRMPDFFLISGLFLSRVIDRDWRTYLDRKLLHFLYFYVLWLTIQTLVKGVWYGGAPSEMFQSFLMSFLQPFGTMWFIYLLPVFFIVTKLMRNISPVLVFLLAAELEVLDVATGWVAIDEFAGRYVYFFLGYWLAPHIFTMADWVRNNTLAAITGLIVWTAVNGSLVFSGWSGIPFISLGLGVLGAGAVISLSALLSKVHWLSLLRYAGENSIVIYLAFFLSMAATRVFFLKTGLIEDIGTITMIVTAMGVLMPLALFRLLNSLQVGMFLFVRPNWAKLGPGPGETYRGRVQIENS